MSKLIQLNNLNNYRNNLIINEFTKLIKETKEVIDYYLPYKKSKESKGSSQKFLDSYEQNINPAASTRSRKLPTHSYGDHGDKSPVKIKAPLDLNIPKFNKNLKISTQSGHGTLTKWGTKKFL